MLLLPVTILVPSTYRNDFLYVFLALQACWQRLRVVIHLLHTWGQVLVVPGVVVDLHTARHTGKHFQEPCKPVLCKHSIGYDNKVLGSSCASVTTNQVGSMLRSCPVPGHATTQEECDAMESSAAYLLSPIAPAAEEDQQRVLRH